MRGSTFAAAAVALAAGVSAAPQNIDVKVKTTQTTTVQTGVFLWLFDDVSAQLTVIFSHQVCHRD